MPVLSPRRFKFRNYAQTLLQVGQTAVGVIGSANLKIRIDTAIEILDRIPDYFDFGEEESQNFLHLGSLVDMFKSHETE
jgi:hypothetical protein